MRTLTCVAEPIWLARHEYFTQIGGAEWSGVLKRILAVSILLATVPLLGATLSSAESAPREHADQVVVEKSRHTLTLYSKNSILRTYRVALGRNPHGHKQSIQDNRTPEGHYRIDWRNSQSRFHLSLHISYPNAHDLAVAEKQGVKLGGDIMVHGLKNGLGWIGALHQMADWTQGCIAVTNPEIEEIWALVPDGTPIEIKP